MITKNLPSLATPAEQRAMGGKQVCPSCGHKTFVPYLDDRREIIDHSVGICERVNSCAYHYPPRAFYQDQRRMGASVVRPRAVYRQQRPQPRPVFLNDKGFIGKHGDVFRQSVIDTYSKPNHLITYLNGLFGADKVQQMIAAYYIGTSTHWQGATVFYQIDGGGNVHRGKIMLYNPDNGKREHGCNSTVHHKFGVSDKKPSQCLFGEHLLDKYPDKFVAIVESEKTALIASGVITDCIFLACGGCGNLTTAMCRALSDRNVVLFPDNGKLAEWSTKGRVLRPMFKTLLIADIMERPEILEHWALNDGDDIGDLLIACQLNINGFDFGFKEL